MTTLEVRPTKSFRKDLKRIEKRGYDIDLLTNIIKKLRQREILPAKNRDHALTGNYEGYRECHITPDWLLIYRIEDDNLYLVLSRTGKHSDLF